jgi:hypothetical protein
LIPETAALITVHDEEKGGPGWIMEENVVVGVE